MDRQDFKFIFTKLVRVSLNEEFFRERMGFSLSIEYSIQEKEDKNDENDKTVIKILGDLSATNSDEETALNIIMESYFETQLNIKEEDFDEMENSETLKDFLQTPVLNEISLLLAQLTGKALKVPIIMPLDFDNPKESDAELD